jgi:hypothetical protein
MRLAQSNHKTRQRSADGIEAIRQAANGHIVRHYPFGCLGGKPRRLVGKNCMWIVPIVMTSPGLGAVGEVGLVAVAADSHQIVGGTTRREVAAAMKQLREAHGHAVETAFHKARTV